MPAVQNFCAELSVPFVPFTVTTRLTKGLNMNGKEWEKGSQCTYKLPSDPKTVDYRIGVVQCFYTATVRGKECLFAAINESHVFNEINTLKVVDITHPRSAHHVVHLDYIYSLVMFAEYWDPHANHLRIVLHVAFTR
jgi:hypothetical protein